MGTMLWNLKDSRKRSGAFAPRATATCGVWIHAPPQENPGNGGHL